MPVWRSETGSENVPADRLPFERGQPAANLQTQLVQLLRHARPAVASLAQAVPVADMRTKHHVAPLPVRRELCFEARRPRSVTPIRRHKWLRVRLPL